MADEPKTETPVSAVADTAPGAAPAAPSQVAVTAPPQESSVVVAAPAEPTVAETPTLLEQTPDRLAEVKAVEPKHAEAKATEAKAAEAKPADAAKPAEAKAPEPKPEEKKAEAAPAEAAKPLDWGTIKYELPQNLTMDDAQRGEFQAAMEKFRTDPAAAATEVLALGSRMVENFVKDYDAQTLRNQQKAFLQTRKDWATRIMADEQLGGAGHRTAMGAVARVRDAAVPAERRAAFEEALRITGAGDHPEIVRAFHNLAAYIDEPRAENIPTDIKPPKDLGRDPSRRGARVLYDHARSMNGRG